MRRVPTEMADNLRSAAEELLGSFDDVQMHEIASVAGVARSSLYYYFASKDAVLSFLLKSMLGELAEATARAADGSGTPAHRLREVIRAHLEHLNRNPCATQQLVANLGRAGRLPDHLAGVRQAFELPVRDLLAAGAADGTLRRLPDDDLGATALFGATIIVGLKSLVMNGTIDVDEIMGRIGPMFWHGVGPPAA